MPTPRKPVLRRVTKAAAGEQRRPFTPSAPRLVKASSRRVKEELTRRTTGPDDILLPQVGAPECDEDQRARREAQHCQNCLVHHRINPVLNSSNERAASLSALTGALERHGAALD